VVFTEALGVELPVTIAVSAAASGDPVLVPETLLQIVDVIKHDQGLFSAGLLDDQVRQQLVQH
jgi:hypothetical protein